LPHSVPPPPPGAEELEELSDELDDSDEDSDEDEDDPPPPPSSELEDSDEDEEGVGVGIILDSTTTSWRISTTLFGRGNETASGVVKRWFCPSATSTSLPYASTPRTEKVI
jgi:hypothetical protein